MTHNPDDSEPSSRRAGSLDEFETAFDPRAYLDQYFSEIDEEDYFVSRFLASTLSQLPRNLLTLEFGGGPVLSAVAALARRSSEIHFSDYVRANLEEVRRWLDRAPNAFDWRPQIKVVLELEGGSSSPAALAHREALMRRRISRLLYCDATVSAPLGAEMTQYDLVSAQFCTDVAVKTVPEWFQAIRNVDTLVRPGGWLMIGVITGTDSYMIAERAFPHADLTADDVRRAYLDNGYDPASLILETLSVAGKPRDYSGLVMAVGRKGSWSAGQPVS